MNKQTLRAILLMTLLVWALSFSRTFPGTVEEESQMRSLENFLRKAAVIAVEPDIIGGRTAPWIVTLVEGTVKRRAIFKYIDSPRPSLVPSSYKYELAAYELTKLLGIEIVPPVIEREVNGRIGSLQVFLENCRNLKDTERKKLEPPDPQALADAIEEVRVFENLTYDECQNKSDMLIHMDTWKICRVDFADAFSSSPELIPDCDIVRCSRRLYQGLLQLSEETVKSSLAPYLNPDEINALIARKNLIVGKIKALIEAKGEDAVLFSQVPGKGH